MDSLQSFGKLTKFAKRSWHIFTWINAKLNHLIEVAFSFQCFSTDFCMQILATANSKLVIEPQNSVHTDLGKMNERYYDNNATRQTGSQTSWSEIVKVLNLCSNTPRI